MGRAEGERGREGGREGGGRGDEEGDREARVLNENKEHRRYNLIHVFLKTGTEGAHDENESSYGAFVHPRS